MWVDLIDVEKGNTSKSGKAIELNLRGDNDFWVWCPVSCLQTVRRGAFEVEQIKSWVIFKNGWQTRKWCFGL